MSADGAALMEIALGGLRLRVEWTKASPRPGLAAWRPWPRQARETAMQRARRWEADRRHLARLDARLLADVGLDAEAVRNGVPFHGRQA